MMQTLVGHQVSQFCDILLGPESDVILKLSKKQWCICNRLRVHGLEWGGVLRVDPDGGQKGLREVVE